MERCIHGMMRDACGICNPKTKLIPRKPAVQKISTVHGVSALKPKEVRDQGYVVVHPQKGRSDPAFQDINDTTTYIHIDGQPMVWAIEDILRRGPNVKTIRVTPKMRIHMTETHLSLCRARGVEVATGHHKPELVWKKGRMVDKEVYEAQRRFLLGLVGEQKMLFDELLALGFEQASMTSRYFCLNGEEYVPHPGICEEYGYSVVGGSSVGDKINAVFFYLDPTFEASERAKQIGTFMKSRVIRFRVTYQMDTLRQDFFKKHGFKLALKFPLIRLEEFERILQARTNGRLNGLKNTNERSYNALVMRFGLDTAAGGVYRTLEEVGEVLQLTRERVRQLEETAFEFLEIERAER